MELEKITHEAKLPQKRRFDDACGLAHGLDLVGERWALLVVRELLLGPRRFSDLRAALPGLSANVLTQRLTELEERHIVERLRLPPPANVQVYGLTPWGKEAEPMVLAMAQWAYRSPTHDRMLPLNGTAMMLSFKVNLDRAAAAEMVLQVGFRIDGTPYRASLDRGLYHVEAGEVSAPDLAYEGSARGLAKRFYGKMPVDQLAETGELSVSGDAALEARFAALFNLPPRYQPDESGSTLPR
ncbi:DNA-binding HxlR family transcriptional regulator [Sphingobium sp. B1D7B]|uniref:winged helix-turn-helix transcriptional regulator n=1 Tax=unclassified Sphingobium TaxID=2611147 RepID=UPI002224F2CC|nr:MULTISPECIES: winged helix-turn-helix transcriptional regulator [unclassified Sphingobium]MCW2392485.1 DNA-binding HxlR family transcriptional regulator [Sphingobium sp. B11D3A]MCW2404180.1 DNA-binding HxlR family transcriptional regulator [Sphingobium sp. B1D7B]